MEFFKKASSHSLKFKKRRLIASILGFVFFLTSYPLTLWAGPPFLTDDASTMEQGTGYAALYGYLSTSSIIDYIQGPGVEFDVGILSNLELDTYATFLTNLNSPHHYIPRATGMADLLVEIKLRLNDETPLIPKYAIAPQITLPTGALSESLGYGRSTYYLPINIEKNFNKVWKAYGQIGYTILSIPTLHKFITGGVALERNITKNLMLGAELYYTEGFDARYNPPYALLNIGGSYYIDEKTSIILGIGHSVWGDPHWTCYFAVGIG